MMTTSKLKVLSIIGLLLVLSLGPLSVKPAMAPSADPYLVSIRRDTTQLTLPWNATGDYANGTWLLNSERYDSGSGVFGPFAFEIPYVSGAPPPKYQSAKHVYTVVMDCGGHVPSMVGGKGKITSWSYDASARSPNGSLTIVVESIQNKVSGPPALTYFVVGLIVDFNPDHFWMFGMYVSFDADNFQMGLVANGTLGVNVTGAPPSYPVGAKGNVQIFMPDAAPEYFGHSIDEVIIALDGAAIAATMTRTANAGEPGYLWVFQITFSTHAITANANPPSKMKIPLFQGWNLISLPVIPKDSVTGAVVTDIKVVLKYQLDAKQVTAVHGYTPASASLPGGVRSWKSYICTATSCSGTLTTMETGYGYWIYMKANDTLYVDGYVIAPGSVPPTYMQGLGWDLVGFKPQPDPNGTATVGAYLNSINASYDHNNVWIYDNEDGTWIRADTNPTTGTVLRPGDAFWVLMTAIALLKP